MKRAPCVTYTLAALRKHAMTESRTIWNEKVSKMNEIDWHDVGTRAVYIFH